MSNQPTGSSDVDRLQEIRGMLSRAQTQKRYRELIHNARLKCSSEAVLNRYPWQSKIAILELTRLALERQLTGAQQPNRREDHSIRLLTSRFPTEVYGGETEQLIHKFLLTGGRFKILMWCQETTTKVDTRLAAFGGSARMTGTFESRISGTDELGDQISHFMLIDDDAFRFELPHRTFNENEFTDTSPQVPARICFNDKVRGNTLREHFDNLWQLAVSNA